MRMKGLNSLFTPVMVSSPVTSSGLSSRLLDTSNFIQVFRDSQGSLRHTSKIRELARAEFLQLASDTDGLSWRDRHPTLCFTNLTHQDPFDSRETSHLPR